MKQKISRKFNIVGKSEIKVDGPALATGRAKFVDDMLFKDMLFLKMLWSPYAHARIKSIDVSEALKVPGVAKILTWKDVPRVAHTTAGQGYPEPSPYDTIMLDNKVRFIGDRVCAVVADTEALAAEAASLVKVEYEVLEPVFDPEKSLQPGAPVIHDEKEAHAIIPFNYNPKKNLVAHVSVEVGDTKKGFAESDTVVEGRFYAHYAAHCCLETHICISYPDENNRLVIRTSTQVPFHVRRIVSERLRVPEGKIRVVKPRIGGGFGGKQEVFMEDICAYMAMTTGRPVKFMLTREEEFISSRTRHPMVMQVKLGSKKDGLVNSIQMNVVQNNGAYGAHGLTIGCNTGSKILPLFNKAKNIQFSLDTAYTNLPVCGAYRGYGATEGYYPFCVLVDELAEKMNMDILKIYKKNHIREGESSPVFAMLGEGRAGVKMVIQSCELDKCIDLGAKEIGWYAKKGKKRVEGSWHFGIGMCGLMQGSSIPEIDMAAATIKMNEDGSFNLLMGATDLGTGSDTVLGQIAAEVLGIKLSDLIIYSSDTDFTPFDVGAYASSTTYLSGQAVRDAAENIKKEIIQCAAKILKTTPKNIILKDKKAVNIRNKKSVPFSKIASFSLYERGEQRQLIGSASKISKISPPPFSAHFAEVAVDIDTGVVKVIKYVAAVDCGTAINPKLAEGQTEGGVLNGISYALTEEYIFDEKGRMLNPNFMNYKIFNTMDLPEIKTILIPSYEPTGPYGAKSVSEICINGALPVLANAIYDAVGIRLYTAPFTPETVYKAIKEKMK